jgi:hypothetical protein
MLAFGICESEYFATTLFQSPFVETQSCTSSMVALPEPGARAFPLFLNIVYQATSLPHAMAMLRDELIIIHDSNNDNGNDNSTINTASYKSNLVELLHLANFFQAKQIYRAVKLVMVRNQGNFGCFESIYHQVDEFSVPIQRVMDFLEHYLAKNIISLCPPQQQHPILQVHFHFRRA